jgi:hypothetical protein
MINVCEGTFIAMRRQLNVQSNTTEMVKVKRVWHFDIKWPLEDA